MQSIILDITLFPEFNFFKHKVEQIETHPSSHCYLFYWTERLKTMVSGNFIVFEIDHSSQNLLPKKCRSRVYQFLSIFKTDVSPSIPIYLKLFWSQVGLY